MGKAGDAAHPGGQPEPSPGSSSRPAAIETVSVCAHPGLPKADAKVGLGTHEISRAMAARKNAAAARGAWGATSRGGRSEPGRPLLLPLLLLMLILLLLLKGFQAVDRHEHAADSMNVPADAPHGPLGTAISTFRNAFFPKRSRGLAKGAQEQDSENRAGTGVRRAGRRQAEGAGRVTLGQQARALGSWRPRPHGSPPLGLRGPEQRPGLPGAISRGWFLSPKLRTN